MDALIKQGYCTYFDLFKLGAIKHFIKMEMRDTGIVDKQIIDIKGNKWNYHHLDGNYKLETNGIDK